MSNPSVFLHLYVEGKKYSRCDLCKKTTTCLEIDATWTLLGQSEMSVCNACFDNVTTAVFGAEKFFKMTIENTLAEEIEYAKKKALEEWGQALESDQTEAKLRGTARGLVQLAKGELGSDFTTIAAIKFVRQHTGLGLKDSKDLVEQGLHDLNSNGKMTEQATAIGFTAVSDKSG